MVYFLFIYKLLFLLHLGLTDDGEHGWTCKNPDIYRFNYGLSKENNDTFPLCSKFNSSDWKVSSNKLRTRVYVIVLNKFLVYYLNTPLTTITK